MMTLGRPRLAFHGVIGPVNRGKIHSKERMMTACNKHRKLKSLTAYHEAGHAIVADQLDIHVKRVTMVLDSDVGNIGYALYENIILGRAPEYDLSLGSQGSIANQARIALDDHVTQTIYAPRSYYVAREDLRNAAFGWALIVNHECEDAARAWFKWLEVQVKNLLNCRWEFVEAVATELLKRGTLEADQFQAVMRNVLHAKRKEHIRQVCQT